MLEGSRPVVRIITRPGQSKGDALRAGFEAATGDIMVMIDADGSNDLPRFPYSSGPGKPASTSPCSINNWPEVCHLGFADGDTRGSGQRKRGSSSS